MVTLLTIQKLILKLFLLLPRKTTKKYLSKIRYSSLPVEGGRKAYIPEILTITIQRILETIGYQGNGGRLYVEVVYGFDGAG